MPPRAATFGDCAPLLMGQKLEGVEREKIETVLRSEFEESAKANGYNVPLAISMVSASVEVWLIRNKQTRELRYVTAEEWRDQVEIVGRSDGNPNAQWQRVSIVVPEGRLLTMDTEKAQRYGFASKVVRDDAERPYAGLMRAFNIVKEPTVLEDTWSERVVEFLTSPLVTTILFMAGLFCLYTEVRTPGFGIFGILGIICFVLLLGSRYLIGLAQWWEIGLFVLGLVLIAIELFVTPGFGVLGVSGILCCIVALVAIAVPNPPDKLPIPQTSLDWSVFENGLFALAIGFLLALVAALVAAKYLPQIPIAGRLILVPAGGGGGGPMSESSPLARINPGDAGIVETMCRPVGKVRFGDDLLDAASEGDIIEAGAKVRVLRREGNHLVVEKIESA
jgi:membrane-bound serine protease (ClpP class)